MTRLELRRTILLTLTEQGEIVSLFRFLIEHDFYSYPHGLATVRCMEVEGLVSIGKLTDRPGKPLHITKGKRWITPLCSCVEYSASLQPSQPSR